MTREEILSKIKDYRTAEQQEINRIGKIQGALSVYQELLAELDAEDASKKKKKG